MIEDDDPLNPKNWPEQKPTKSIQSLREMGTGPILGITYGDQRRDIDINDLKLARIPPAFKDVTVAGIQDEEAKKLISKYISKVVAMLAKPVGLIINGNVGVGKSAAAALVGMEARRWYKSVWRLTHQDMQKIQWDANYLRREDGQSASDRILSVDLLVLDNFNDDFVIDTTFGPVKLEKLIQTRADWMKATILTTRIMADQFKTDVSLKSLYGVARGSMVGVQISGDDLHQKRNDHLKSILGE